MDDHMYQQMFSYAECELIPRFQKEYAENGIMKNCSSYKEIQDLCTALNVVAPWAGYEKISPSFFIE